MAKTDKKPMMRVTSFIRECPRFLKLALQGARNETLPAPEGQEGTRIHKLLEDFMKGRNKDYLMEFPEPTDLIKLQESKDTIEILSESEIRIEEFAIDIIGHPDLIFIQKDRIVLIDMKTGYWASPKDKSYRNQMRIYAYPYLKTSDKIVQTFLFKPSYADFLPVETLDPMSELEIKAYIQKKVSLILSLEKEENPKTKGGVDCKYCPYSISCPDNPFSDIQKDPEGFIAELIKRKAGYTQMEKIAKEYMKEKEPIVVNGMQAGYIDSHTLKVDVAEYIKTCMEQEIQPALNVDTTIFRRQAKQNDLIANTGHYEIKPRWSIKKANKEE